MSMGKQKFIALVAMLASGIAAQTQAAEQNCISLETAAQVEKETTGANGEKSKVLVPAGKVVPGTEVIWTVTANNVCKLPSDKVTINNPVPEHMTLVPNSATGPGSDITYSVDGKQFATAGKLTVQENGAARPARAEEYRHIRWEFKNSLQPGARAVAQFRAVLN
jgi:uncharacterized repeat protein (TIGR01451 family)